MKNKLQDVSRKLQTSKITHKILKTGVIMSLVFGLWSLRGILYAEEVARIAAKVNKEIITSQDLADYCKVISYQLDNNSTKFDCSGEESKSEVLDKLIGDKLILDRAKRENISVPSSWVEKKLQEIVSSYPSREIFEASLVDRGLNVSRLKKRIKEQYLVQQVIDRYVRSLVYVRPADISDYYRSHFSDFMLPETYILWIGKSKNRQLLGKVAQKIRAEGIREAEEEYGSVIMRVEASKKDLREDILGYLKNRKEGEYIIEEIDGLPHLIYLEKILPPHLLSLEKSKDKIYFFLWQQKFKERFSSWLEELKKKAFIKIYH